MLCTRVYARIGIANSHVLSPILSVQLCSWMAYMSVQGTSPGYVEPGMVSGVTNAAVEESGVGAATGTGMDYAGETAAAPEEISIDAGHEPASPTRSRYGNTSINVGASGPGDHRQDGDGLQLLGGHELDYDPEHASDPVGTALEAAAAARAGHRECTRCHVQQPPRSHHCKECNRCVATFDHHCAMINTCIGERNRARFWWLLFFQSLSLATAIGILNTAFVWRRNTSDWVSANGWAIAALCVLWLLQLFVFGLLVLHTWLACTNTTTYETTVGAKKLWYLAGTEPRDCDLPFSKGCCGNLRLFCCVLDGWCGCVAVICRRASNARGKNWQPQQWGYPGIIERESSNVCANIWENKYWSCC